VYAGSDDNAGHIYALDSKTEQVLWSFASGGSVIDGPSIVNWGSGYSRMGTGNNKWFAFTVQ
jgi:polyvinyl alcohol dehydrogenase (cytochrome)